MSFVLFPQNPLVPRLVDPMYESEWRAVQEIGPYARLIDFEALLDGDGQRATRRVYDSGQAIWRGWMMAPIHYEILYQALFDKQVYLNTTPPAYKMTHWLPENYPMIEGYTPRSTWLPNGQITVDRLDEVIAFFDGGPMVVKDYVKSEKSFWAEAMYIPMPHELRRVVQGFYEHRVTIEGGLVFREFLPLEKSEFRIWYHRGEPIRIVCHEGAADVTLPKSFPLNMFNRLASKIPNSFFTMDVVRNRDTGEWLVLELGDGQVAGLEGANPEEFYARLLGQPQGVG